MKLIDLKLENFQGIKNMSFHFDKKSASIFGDNATGKTTVFNAFTWLLFDKASTGAKNFNPKTTDSHYLDHSAEAVFSSDNGRVISLKKVFHEVYKKKRGSVNEEFDGHEVLYYVDGVPSKEKEFQTTLSNVFGDAEQMKMLTMPNYFPEEMTWDARRKILLDICGDVTDEDVISSTEELKELPNYLQMPGTETQSYTVDQYKKIAGVKEADINKEKLNIPSRIDEALRATPDVREFDIPAIDKKIKELSKQKEELEVEKVQALNGDLTTAAMRNQISDAKSQLAEAKAAHATQSNTLNESIYTSINSIKRDQIIDKNSLQDAKNDMERALKTVDRLKDNRISLIADYKKKADEVWDEGKEICPTCHRPLELSEVQNLRDDFNIKKSQHLEAINTQGYKECNKDMISGQEDKIRELQDKINSYTQSIDVYDQKIKALQEQLKTPVPFESSEDYIQITAKLAALRADESNTDNKTASIIEGLKAKIQVIYNEIRAQEDIKTRISLAASQEKRVTELKAREKELSKQYEVLEKGLYLCDCFIKAKVNLLTDRINSKFQNVRFRLFVDQINGGLKEDCEVMIPANGRLVPFSLANNAARINAGLEIISALSVHWNLSMPVFIDNAESVTRLLQIDTQVIRLVVDEDFSRLAIAVGDEVLEYEKHKTSHMGVAV